MAKKKAKKAKTNEDVQAKADAFDQIAEKNVEVMELAVVMNLKHAAHQQAIKDYKEADKEMQKLIATCSESLPLFEQANPEKGKKKKEDEAA